MGSVISHIAGTPKGFGRRFLTVGDGGDFSTIQAAIDSIIDSTATNGYVVYVLPGVYDAFSFDGKTGITVRGSGDSTVINTYSGKPNAVLIHSTDCTLEDMRIKYNDDRGFAFVQGAIRRDGSVERFAARNISIEVEASAIATAQRYGIYVEYITNSRSRWDNITIVTNCSGIYAPSGWNDWRGCNVWLVGDDCPLTRYGVIQEAGGRNYFYACRITTGYGETNPEHTQDQYCVFVPAENTGAVRIHLYNCEMFSANTHATPGTLRCIKAENGWVRVFGGMYQAENQNTTPAYTEHAFEGAWRTASEPVSGLGGKIEVYGARYTGHAGNIIGGSSTPITYLDTTNDGDNVPKFDARYIICDPSAGAFTLDFVSGVNVSQNNSIYTVKNIDSTNAVTLDFGGGTIDGAATLSVPAGAVKHVLQYEVDKWTEV